MAKKNPLGVPGVTDALKSLDILVGAWKECTVTTAVEKTKRERIRADRDVNVKAIEENAAILKLYLKETFRERGQVIDGMFERLDRSLAAGDNELASKAIEAIISVSKVSPLEGARDLIASMKDPKVTLIDI
jgi:hypothetical protein